MRRLTLPPLADLLKEMERTPEFARKTRTTAQFRKAVAEDQKGILRDSERVGLSVDSVSDFVMTRDSYPEAIPVLLAHIQQDHHPAVKATIARALTVREARGRIVEELIAEFKRSPTDNPQERSAKWAIGNTLAYVATEKYADEILALLRDTSHGDARGMLPRALARFKDPRMNEALLDATYDPSKAVVMQAVWALRRRKAAQAVERLQELTAHPTNKELRKQAAKALQRILG